MSSILSKLACCCNSAGRKLPAAAPPAAPTDASVAEASEVEEVQRRAHGMLLAQQGADSTAELAKIRDVAFCLIKKATIDIVHSRIVDRMPNDAFAPVLGRELGKISQHPEFGELIKVILSGPSEENRAKAERFAFNIASFLIEEAEKDVPMCLN